MGIDEKLKLDAICNEAFAKLDGMGDRMYALGWLCFGGKRYNDAKRALDRGAGVSLEAIRPDPQGGNGRGGPRVGGYEPRPEPVKPQPGAAAMLRELI